MGCIAAMGGRGAKAAGGPDALCGAIRGGKAGSGGASTRGFLVPRIISWTSGGKSSSTN